MSDKKHNPAGIIIGSIFSLLIFVLAGWLLFNRQFVVDQLAVWSFTPSSEVSAIEDRIDFTNKGSFYFLATQPSIDQAETFNQDCPRQETGSPIVGCYASGRIYIYDITNEKLNGIKEVTVAHETLHAIWERASAEEQKRLGGLLRAEYAKLDDGELKTRMDYYARTEPGQFENELHSIIGTEVADISPELETYYSHFFEDRQIILNFHAQYSAVFEDLSTRADTLYGELTALSDSIARRTTQYNSDVTLLSADIAAFNERANNGGFASMNQFNNERAALVARSNQLGSERTAINSDIATYTAKYDQYQEIAGEIEILNKSIDSITNLEPAPSL